MVSLQLNVSLYIFLLLFIFITVWQIEFIWTHSIPGLKHDILIRVEFLVTFLCFPFPRILSIELECFLNLFISPCQTVALTQSCWSKWKSWRCTASQQQRLGIWKLHFNCSARQSSCCPGERLPITTGLRPCGYRGTQQVRSSHSFTLWCLKPAWQYIAAMCLWCTPEWSCSV